MVEEEDLGIVEQVLDQMPMIGEQLLLIFLQVLVAKDKIRVVMVAAAEVAAEVLSLDLPQVQFLLW